MLGFLIRRTAAAVFLLWAVVTLAFVVVEAAPGDPIERFVDPRVPRHQAERIRSLYGLDQPLATRYFSWLNAIALHGDLGVSFLEHRPVRAVLRDRIGPTALLGATALVLAFGFGFLGGMAAARWHGTWVDSSIRIGALGLYATPGFWLGIMLLLLLGGLAGIVPLGGMTSVHAPSSGPGRWWDVARHLALPALVLALPLASVLSRLWRNTLLEEGRKEYVIAARARGLPEHIVRRHVVRNTLAMPIQLLGLWLPLLVGGAVTIEYVFSWPGLGSLLATAIGSRDYPLVLGITLLSTLVVVLGNAIADLLHVAVDPRLREPTR